MSSDCNAETLDKMLNAVVKLRENSCERFNKGKLEGPEWESFCGEQSAFNECIDILMHGTDPTGFVTDIILIQEGRYDQMPADWSGLDRFNGRDFAFKNALAVIRDIKERERHD